MKLMKIFLRIISLPFVVGIMSIQTIWLLIRWIYNWLVYGGETVIYNDKFNKATITEVYKIVQDQHLDKLARQHFPEDTGLHIDMREVWIERHKNNQTDAKKK